MEGCMRFDDLDARMRMLGEYDRLALPIWIAGGFPLFAAQTALAMPSA